MTQQTENPQICVCYNVHQDEILKAAANGAHTLTQMQDTTYACLGCGGCQRKVEALIQQQLDQIK